MKWCQLETYIDDSPCQMWSIDYIMNVVSLLFLEILFGVRLLTTNVNLYTNYKVDIWM